MDIALFPNDASEPTLAALARAGIQPAAVEALAEVTLQSAADWSILVVELGEEPMRRLRQVEAIASDSGLPVLVVADSEDLSLVEKAAGVTDFILAPVQPEELKLRLHRLHSSGGEEVLTYKDLTLNPLTYQAQLAGAPLDLTFMEYELLRFLIEHQGRVWTREQLLSKVWGYDYFGGARTVDVHVRRLRAKLGEERSSWITTVRSVGYRWG